MLERGGPLGRAEKLVARGSCVNDAARTAAAQGKGHYAEVQQATGYSATAAVLEGAHRARPNRVSNDPRVDVEVLRGRVRRRGVQVKVGSPEYLRRALDRDYGHVVANAEAIQALESRGSIPARLKDRLDYRGATAQQVRASDCEDGATAVLTRMLLDEPVVTELDLLASAARAGAVDGAMSFTLSLATAIADATFHGYKVDVQFALKGAASSAAKAFAKTAIQSRILAHQFLSRARDAFSAHLVRRIAGSALVVGAIAEVVVETASDFLAVLRGQLAFDELLQRFGVHVSTAGGAALGAYVAAVLTGGASLWVSALAMLAGGYLGSRAGRAVGETIFLQVAPTPLLR